MHERTSTAGLQVGEERIAALSSSSDGLVTEPVAPAQGRVLLTLRNIRKSYVSANGEVANILKGVNLDITAGSFNVIRGESGSGKTSLLRILGMLDSNFEGDYIFAGEDVKARPDWFTDELRSNNIDFIFVFAT